MKNQENKLCYLLPHYDSQDATHFSHIHDFLKELGKTVSILLLVEKGDVPKNSIGEKEARFIGGGFLFRLLRTLHAIISARMRGYKKVYVHYSFSGALIASCVMRLTGGEVYYWNCGEPWKYKRSFGRTIFESLTYTMISYFVTGSISLGYEYAKRYHFSPNKIRVMPNWIDISRFNNIPQSEAKKVLNISESSNVILFVHRISKRKGAHLIIPIAKKIIEQFPLVRFLIVGKGPDAEVIRQEIIDSNLGEVVTLIGSVPNTNLPTYFSAADVFLMPSEEEGFPRVLLESMALGVPFVSSDVGSVRDIVPEEMKHAVVSYGDVDAYVYELSQFLSMDREQKNNMSIRLKEYVQQFSVQKVVDIYKKIVFS